jgi:hypothetical protein
VEYGGAALVGLLCCLVGMFAVIYIAAMLARHTGKRD